MTSQVQRWLYTYESSFNQLKTKTDPLGRTTTYIYDYEEEAGSAGKRIRIDYPLVANELGQVVLPTIQYTYNAWGLLATETDALGTVTQYIYTQGTADEAAGGANPLFASGVTPVPGLLTQVVEDAGGENLTTSFRDFDAAGYPGTTVAPGEHLTTTYAYDNMNRILSATNTDNVVTTYAYDGRGNLIHQVLDESGRHVAIDYTYNDQDQVLSERIVDDGLTVQTTYAYDINNRLTRVRDGLGNETVYRYDAADQLIQIVDPTGEVASSTYTLDGQIERITDADGYITGYIYDGLGRRIQEIQDEGGLGLTTHYVYDLNDNLKVITGTTGVATCYDYDSHNRLTTERFDCGALHLSHTYAYDVNGNLVYETDSHGIITYRQFDPLNRLTLARTDDGGLNLTTTYLYDPAGNLYQEIDERGVISEYHYDTLNRLVESCADRLGLNLCTSFTYDSLHNRQTMTDPKGITTLTAYNAFGLLTQRVQDVGGLQATTDYSYNQALNVVQAVDANGNATHYSYTPRNELASETRADATTVQYAYDGRGLLTTYTDQTGATITNTHDGAGRLTDKTFSTGGWQRFGYDGLGRVTQAEESLNGHQSLVTYDYNALGSVVSTTQHIDGQAWSVGYAYDYHSDVYTTTYPSGTVRVRTLDALGRLDTVQQGDGSVVANYDYYDQNSYFTLAYANGLTTHQAYDTLYRTTHISSTVADYRYGYDAAGNPTYEQSFHKVGQPADVYLYDNLHQVTQVWYGADATDPSSVVNYDSWQQHNLDKLGNRLTTQEDSVTTTYLPHNGQQLTNPMNRYEEVDGNTLTYDLRGNTLTDGSNTYQYDILNRQTSMNGAGGTAQYIYDALGRRVAKTVDGVTTYFIYDTQYQVLEERASDNTVLARYTYGQNVDEPLTMERDGQTYFYHRDALGNITEMTNVTGTLVERYEYDVYGQATIFDGAYNPLSASTIGNAYLYTGRRYDVESGNYYYRARYYQPTLGRFLSEDPLGFSAGDMNIYRYVSNRPTSMIDPTGLVNWLGVLDRVDQAVAGFADTVTFGATTKLRTKLYGDVATQNHKGAYFTGGQLVGAAWGVALGYGTVGNGARAASWGVRGAQAYTGLSTAVGLGQSTA